MSTGSTIANARRKAGLTQAALAEAMDVSFQAVSSWERDCTFPKSQHLKKLCSLLHLPSSVFTEEEPLPESGDAVVFADPMHMYTFIRSAAVSRRLSETLRLLPSLKEKLGADGASDTEKLFFTRSLTAACHALALGFGEDDVLMASVLVYGLPDGAASFPCSAAVKALCGSACALAETLPADSSNPQPVLLALLSRLALLSFLPAGLSKRELIGFIRDTEDTLLPMTAVLKNAGALYNNAAWLLRYHLSGVTNALRRGL